jgi:hypothetical protein
MADDGETIDVQRMRLAMTLLVAAITDRCTADNPDDMAFDVDVVHGHAQRLIEHEVARVGPENITARVGDLVFAVISDLLFCAGHMVGTATFWASLADPTRTRVEHFEGMVTAAWGGIDGLEAASE